MTVRLLMKGGSKRASMRVRRSALASGISVKSAPARRCGEAPTRIPVLLSAMVANAAITAFCGIGTRGTGSGEALSRLGWRPARLVMDTCSGCGDVVLVAVDEATME